MAWKALNFLACLLKRLYIVKMQRLEWNISYIKKKKRLHQGSRFSVSLRAKMWHPVWRLSRVTVPRMFEKEFRASIDHFDFFFPLIVTLYLQG